MMQAIEDQAAAVEFYGLRTEETSQQPPQPPVPQPLHPYEVVRKLAEENAVVVFSMSGCCMCTVAKRLLFSLGVGPTVVELDLLQGVVGAEVRSVIFELCSGRMMAGVPAIFVGGKFLGGIDTLMASHINGSLVPLLKDAGALWL